MKIKLFIFALLSLGFVNFGSLSHSIKIDPTEQERSRIEKADEEGQFGKDRVSKNSQNLSECSITVGSSCNHPPKREADCKCIPECLEINIHCGCKESCGCRTAPSH